jgi:hypothetical protein
MTDDDNGLVSADTTVTIASWSPVGVAVQRLLGSPCPATLVVTDEIGRIDGASGVGNGRDVRRQRWTSLGRPARMREFAAIVDVEQVVVVMRKYLVVANQTLQGAGLREEVSKRIGAGPSSFYVRVPNTRAAHYLTVPVAGGVLPMPSVVDYDAPASDEEASAQARRRLERMMADIAAVGVQIDGASETRIRSRRSASSSRNRSLMRSLWRRCLEEPRDGSGLTSLPGLSAGSACR